MECFVSKVSQGIELDRSTLALLPRWSDHTFVDVTLARRDVLRSSRNILVQHVKKLICAALLHDDDYVPFFSAFSAASPIRELDLTSHPHARGHMPFELCDALPTLFRLNLPNLQQLRIDLEIVPHRRPPILEAIGKLPLKALSLTARGATKTCLSAIAEMMICLRDSIEVLLLQISNGEPNMEGIGGLFKEIAEKVTMAAETTKFSKLRVLQIPWGAIEASSRLPELPLALGLMPCLEELEICIEFHILGLRALSAHFSRPDCPTKKLCVHVCGFEAQHELQFVQFFSSLKRLSSLEFTYSFEETDFYVEALVSSDLLEHGWLTELNVHYEDIKAWRQDVNLQRWIVQATHRNRLRHDNCFRACLQLLTLRKLRAGAVANVSTDVIRIIAQNMWQSRNQHVWDIEETNPIDRRKRPKMM